MCSITCCKSRGFSPAENKFKYPLPSIQDTRCLQRQEMLLIQMCLNTAIQLSKQDGHSRDVENCTTNMHTQTWPSAGSSCHLQPTHASDKVNSKHHTSRHLQLPQITKSIYNIVKTQSSKEVRLHQAPAMPNSAAVDREPNNLIPCVCTCGSCVHHDNKLRALAFLSNFEQIQHKTLVKAKWRTDILKTLSC